MSALLFTDAMILRLSEEGLATSAALRPDAGLAVPCTMTLSMGWSLPSRLFRFPVEVCSPTATHPRRIGLRHPKLGDHPFVCAIEEALAIELDPAGAPNAYGYSSQRTARWWHAVDLVSVGCWRELLKTAHFTTAEGIAGAVAYGLDYAGEGRTPRRGHITTAEARQMLRAICAGEPSDRGALLLQLSTPKLVNSDGCAAHWPINNGFELDAQGRAWSRVFGIEEGWFDYDRSGFLGWTEAGRNRHAGGDTGRFTEASGQVALVF